MFLWSLDQFCRVVFFFLFTRSVRRIESLNYMYMYLISWIKKIILFSSEYEHTQYNFFFSITPSVLHLHLNLLHFARSYHDSEYHWTDFIHIVLQNYIDLLIQVPWNYVKISGYRHNYKIYVLKFINSYCDRYLCLFLIYSIVAYCLFNVIVKYSFHNCIKI